jgi:nucleotidyltransferase substrate binding protein (TIGR01987 family)
MDIRWKQRLENYSNALEQLRRAVLQTGPLSNLEKEGTIQRFEFTHELAWKVMRDYLEYEGISGITGSRSAVRQAFSNGLLEDGQSWMDMIESRNRTVHTYMEQVLLQEYKNITERYFPLLEQFENRMKELG